MKALTLVAHGGPEQLKVQELPQPSITSPDQVLVRMRTAALNRLDLFIAAGLPGSALQFPHVVGSDGAGVVEQAGEAVRQFRTGDRVMINPTLSCGDCPACREGEHSLCARLRVLGEHCAGTVAEFVVVPAQNLVPVPTAMPWPQAAAFSLATLTAWRMLVTRARLEVGESVLIWGIGGGVALAALQIAKLIGARTIVTSGSEAKLDTARGLGADVSFNHRNADVVAEVKRHTGGRGADVVVDSVGEETWNGSLRAVRRGGRLVVCGATTGPMVSLDLRRLFWHQWSILGSTLGNRQEYAEIVRHAQEGRLWPVVDRVVPLAASIAAFERLQRGEQFGKLVIEVAQ
ncbi:MAG TPA: zinc-binding dehydrogenase [Gemmatimonadales bacterium]|nr:zinc-binding dehydrogenase [Gemmatimonadales bacterium]